MKKLLVLLLVVLGNLPIMAYDFEVDGIYYNITSASNNTVEVTYQREWSGYPYRCSYTGSVHIPKKVSHNGTEYVVNGIGKHAFETSPSSELTSYMHKVKSIYLPSTITYIGQCAFYMCDSIESLIIPASVTSIGNDSFWCRNSKNPER